MKKKWVALLVALVILTGSASTLAATPSKTTEDLTRVIGVETKAGEISDAIIWVEETPSEVAKTQLDAMKSFVEKKNPPVNYFPDAAKTEIAALVPKGTDLTKLNLSEYAAFSVGDYDATLGDIYATFQFPTVFTVGKTVVALVGFKSSDGTIVWHALETIVVNGNLRIVFPSTLLEKSGHELVLAVLSN